MRELPIRLYRTAQVRELDRIAIEDRGIPGYTLMNRAGEAAFRLLCQRWPAVQRMVVLCGGGNNGGDGYVVARLAHQSGLTVQVLTLKDPGTLAGDALTAYQDAHALDIPIIPFTPNALSEAELIVDAIFGTGLEREVSGIWREAIEAANKHHADILALDIPSGLHADTGASLGIVVQAKATITFIGLKQGLYTGQGPTCCGDLYFEDLDVPADVYSVIHPACWRYAGQDLGTWLPKRPRSGHKGLFGHVLIIGGDLGMAGAARMAAEAAARCGAGLVSVATRCAHAGLQATVCPELMFHGVETPEALEPLLRRATIIAIGPGLGRNDWGRAMLHATLASDKPLIIDADGLNQLVVERHYRDDWILTPHPGEAARLLKMLPGEVEADRFTAVEELAVRLGGTVVLKGAGSLIASRKAGQVMLCAAGNPGMASGGMGDVLTGVIAALRGQGLSPFVAAKVGVYLHGRAGDLAAQAGGERGLLATDLLPFLRQLVNP
ncbi:MAG: bifunctional ADP-dependent NAD(P)H-hydrate dehydratase/NAD(P)H-hydrate epimerase [Candidatus Contendobacter odensis]|uniref:Bifunctional NAD(P)H-hydrate repair enzyme n=1 Tax=Candidatus Contendibacter odensensis TaxID=1400860 RepID=A0A2G6PGJ4_9GAMM|nr:MAG: bifunctional ADP-dependent NAD(P)H-hydrate dehydratase/NAD(P)H-hydrate epimerase [Candidatus Contendobacter odensis]